MNPDPSSSFQATPADWAVLRQCRPDAFDGHTGFDRLTPAARLAWLDTAVQFVAENKGRKSTAGAVPRGAVRVLR